MLSSAALQKFERYAQIALAKCGVSATLAHAANDATAPIALSPFVSSSYDNFSLAAAVAAQQNNNNSITNAKDTSSADKGAMNRSVLLSTDLWAQVAQQLSASNSNSNNSATAAANGTTVSEGLIVAIALAVQMSQWEADHYLSGPIAAASAVAAEQRLAHLTAVLDSIIAVLTAISRDRAVESPSLTLACATLTSTAVNAALSSLFACHDALLVSNANPIEAASSSPFGYDAPAVAAHRRLTQPLLEIAALAAQQLRRAGAAYPLPRLFTVRVAAQQLKQLGSGYINAIKDTNDGPAARAGAIGKMRLLQRFGLLYGVLREYTAAKALYTERREAARNGTNKKIQHNNSSITNNTNGNASSSFESSEEAKALEACREALIDAATPYVCTRTSRHHIYFRTEADESRLAMSGCSDIPTQVAPIDFVLTPPVDPDAITTMQRMRQSPAAKAAIAVTLQSWAGATELIYIAFCRDGSWSVFAADARRRILAEHAAKKSRANKKALKEEEKEIQRQMKQKAVEALLKAKEEEHKELMKLRKAENDAANGIVPSDKKKKNTGDSDDDDDENDDAKSNASGISALSGKSGLSALSGRSGVSALTGQTATTMSKAESDVRSVMSAASFQSYSTFLSVVDSEAIANEQRMQHESADGNTNLPVMFLEMACLALHQFLESVGGSGNNAFVVRPEGTEEGGAGAGPTNTEALAILPLPVVESVWAAISGMFTAFAAFVDAQPRTGLVCFSLSEDVQYNKGLGYQSLGLLFARILVPALLKERACSGAAEDAEAAALIEALHVSQTLAIYERVASQAINQNLAAVLDMCCSAIAAPSSSSAAVISSKGGGKKIASASTSSFAATSTATQRILERLLVTIVSRLGQTNQLGLLLRAVITDHEAELRKREAEAKALKKLNGDDEDDEDDEDEDDEAVIARKAAKAKAEAVDREMALRRTVLPFASSLRLLSTPAFREAFCVSVRRSLDPEGLLETLGDALAALLLGIGGDDDADDAASTKSGDDADAEEDPANDPTVRSFRTTVHLRAPVLLGAAALVFKGLVPTSLVAFSIFEKCAEIEAYLLLFLEGSLYPALSHKADAAEEDDEAAPSDNAFLLQYLLQSAVPSSSAASSDASQQQRVKPAHLRRLFLCVAEGLAVLRDTMYGVCLRDLGVDQLEKVVAVMDESLWQISDITAAASDEGEEGDTLRFLTYDKDSALTLSAVREHCVDAEATRSPITGALAINVLIRLAAQRLQLITSIGGLMRGNIKIPSDNAEENADESDNAAPAYAIAIDADAIAAPPAYAEAAKALGAFVGQNIATALTSSSAIVGDGAVDSSAAADAAAAASAAPHTILTVEEWISVVRAVGPKRWRKYLKTAAAAIGSDASAVLQRSLPAELITIVPTVATVGSDEEDGAADSADAVTARWAAPRQSWRSLGCVPSWDEVLPALCEATAAEGRRVARRLRKGTAAAAAAAVATPPSASALVLQEAFRLSAAAQHAFASASAATAAAFAAVGEESFVEAIVAIAIADSASAGGASSSLLAQLISSATAVAPNGAAAPSAAFLTAVYAYFTAQISADDTADAPRIPRAALLRLLSELLASMPYALPAGAAANAHLAAPLKAFVSLGKAVLKAISVSDAAVEDVAAAAAVSIDECACLLLSKHLPVYCDAADLAKLATKALLGRIGADAAKGCVAAAIAAGRAVPASAALLVVTHLVAASASAANDNDDVKALLASLVAFFAAPKDKAAATSVALSPASRTLWALAASQLVRSTPAAAKKEEATKKEEGAKKEKAAAPAAATDAERLATALLAAVEASLLTAVRAAPTAAALEAPLAALEALSTMQRIRFTTFAPVLVALSAKVTTLASSSSVAASDADIIVPVISRTLALARLPLPALMSDAGHQDAVMGLLFTLSTPHRRRPPRRPCPRALRRFADHLRLRDAPSRRPRPPRCAPPRALRLAAQQHFCPPQRRRRRDQRGWQLCRFLLSRLRNG